MVEAMTDAEIQRIYRKFRQNLCLGTEDGRMVLDEIVRLRAQVATLREAPDAICDLVCEPDLSRAGLFTQLHFAQTLARAAIAATNPALQKEPAK